MKTFIAILFKCYLCLPSINAQRDGQFCSAARPIIPVENLLFADILNQAQQVVASEMSDRVTIIDSVCFAYFATQRNDTYIYYDTRVLHDGTMRASPGLCRDGGPGIVVDSSALCTSIDNAFGYIEECDVYLILRYFLYGYCKADSSSDNDSEVYALASLDSAISEDCRTRILQGFADYGFGDRTFYFYPQRLLSRCVSQQLCSIPSRPVPGYPDIRY